MPKYKIADVVFETNHIYEYIATLCKDYLYIGQEPASFYLEITNSDIAEEEKKAPGFPEALLESTALYRKLVDKLLSDYNGTVFHGSAIAVDGEGYVFTAPSGTGKSTHTRLWRELLGDKAVMINDDKPIIRLVDDKIYIYGTPWTGKHELGENIKVPLKAICKLSRGKENKIRRADEKQMITTLFNQTMRPNDLKKAEVLFEITDKILSDVKLYDLECNISLESAKLSYETMKKGKFYED